MTKWVDYFRSVLHRQEECPDHRMFLLKRVPKQGVCAEIGVWKGDFSSLILEYTKPHKLYLIDCWEFQPLYATAASRKVAKDQQAYDSMYNDVKRRFGGKENVEVIRAYSYEAAELIEDEALDWIYVDANHLYEFVMQDIQLFFPKVKPGGYITGDDYEWGEKDGYPVRRAVNDFIRSHDITVVEITRGQYVLRKEARTRGTG